VEPLGRSEKRKHYEDTEDSDSEGESLNLASALDNYDSDLDSDYVSSDKHYTSVFEKYYCWLK